MIIIPAIDILNHEVVQLVGGKEGTEILKLPDPVSVAKSWVEKGAKYLHVVDLDGAFGKSDNVETIKKIIEECKVPVEVGGGISDEAKIKTLLDAGADRIIVGTKALNDFEWFSEMSKKYPKKLVMALDTKNGKITQKGWQENSAISVDTVFEMICDLPLAGILNTNVDVEGQAKGIDKKEASKFITNSPHPVIASGGVTTVEDAKLLSQYGAEGSVVGVAVYKSILRPWEFEKPWEV